MPTKKDKPMFVPDDMTKPMSREEADKELGTFLKRLEEEYKDTPKELVEIGSRRVLDFIKGEISWADMFNVPKKTIRDMVEYGYLQFQTGRYQEAERFFKVLTVLDWKNSYFHSMMGAVLQRQKRYGEAVAEYTEAIKLNPHDIVSITNRGEIYMLHKHFIKALVDFEKAIALDPKKENKWATRARLCKAQIEQITKAAAPKQPEVKKEKGKKKK